MLHESLKNDAQSTIIDRLRFPLILLVVFIHSFGLPYEGAEPILLHRGSFEIVRTMLSGMIAHSAVPAFFFISGFLMFYHVENYSMPIYRRKMQKRLYTLLLPYLLWNLVALLAWYLRLRSLGISAHMIQLLYTDKGWLSFLWIFGVVGDANRDILGNVTHLTVPANLPLWYLRDLIVVSLLSPLVYVFIKRGRLVALSLFMLLFLSGIFQNVPGLSSVSIAFYSFGAFFSITRTDFSAFFLRCLGPALFIYVVLLAYMVVNFHENATTLLFPLLRLVGVFVMFGIAERAVRYTLPSLPSVFSESTFFVYAIHYVLFLSFVEKQLGTAFSFADEYGQTIQYLLAPLLKTCIYVGMYVALKRVLPKPLSMFMGRR